MRRLDQTPHMRERHLAIVLLDLIGSTAFVQRAGALKAARWLQYHDRLTRSLMYRFQGREIDRSDGFLVSFERCIDAVNFALSYQLEIPRRTHLQTRIGIHYGVVAEVTQHELEVLGGAKPVELEGVAKNIAARTMSLCGPGQVLLTADAFEQVKGRTNHHTPKMTRYALAGLYQFKGVGDPVTVYTVGTTTASLQPPQGSEKVKRLGGPKRVKSRLRHMRALELTKWIMYRLAALSALIIMAHLLKWIARPSARRLWGLDHAPWTWVDPIRELIHTVIQVLTSLLTGDYI